MKRTSLSEKPVAYLKLSLSSPYFFMRSYSARREMPSACHVAVISPWHSFSAVSMTDLLHLLHLVRSLPAPGGQGEHPLGVEAHIRREAPGASLPGGDDQALHRVLELAHVARPGMVDHRRKGSPPSTAGTGTPFLSAACRRKWDTSSATSSERSRSGGTRMLSTMMRW